jgi:RNA polymerase sigma factor (sigma-70 family)
MDEPMTDRELLRDYAERGSESAFQSLVQRHVDMVFATAVRRLGDAAAAQEVTQDVFITLARKAAWLRRETTLAGWLYKTTLFTARQWWRSETRRQHREQTAVELGTTMKDDASLLKSLVGVLDEGLMELREADRQALMLRYFEERSHREIGAMVGANEDAVRKRIDKALDRLTGFFRSRGYGVPAVATTVAVMRAAAQAAPKGLAAVATKAALSAGGAASATGLSLLIARFMGLTKTQTAVVCVVVAGMPVAYQWHDLVDAKSDQQRLNAELTQLRQGINAQERAVNTLERRLRNRERFAADLQTAMDNANSSAARPAAGTANLYLWDEQSDYVRLPKTVASNLTFADFEMQPRGKARPERVQRPAVAKDGTPSQVLLDALGLSDEEARRVNGATRATFEDFAAYAASRGYLTNLDFSMETSTEWQTWFTPSFPDVGRRFYEGLWDSLVQVMGEERTRTFWQQAENAFRDSLNEFGQAPKAVTVARRSRGGVEVGEIYFQPDGSQRLHRSGSAKSIAVPDPLKPYLEAWEKPVAPQPEINPQ